jgi:N-methylhydantoinase B/oxoprolinase/acetone carboxylase alpha subunit
LLVKEAGEARFVTFREAYGTPSNSRVANIKLKLGDQVMLRSPGGGGFGPPAERQPESVLQDVQEGFVSNEQALATYAVAIDGENGAQQVDWDETERRRA